METSKNIFVTDEKRVWMRLRNHTVVFERDPDFQRFLADPSGSVMHILRIWVAFAGAGTPNIQHFIGSVRHCDGDGWMSHRELLRLFRQAGVTARQLGENAGTFRSRLSMLLREHFEN